MDHGEVVGSPCGACLVAILLPPVVATQCLINAGLEVIALQPQWLLSL